MLNRSLLLLPLIFIACFVQANPAVICHELFDLPSEIEQTPFYQKSDFLQKMTKYKYKIEVDSDSGKSVISKQISGEWVDLGELSDVKAPYLYHWSNKSSHIQWEKDGLITKSAMDSILAEEPQALGKGFYISTHPVDSRMFGDFVTVFKTNRALRGLNVYAKELVGNSQQITDELRDLGFEVITTDRYYSWMAVINQSALSKVIPMDKEVFEQFLAHFADEYNIARMPVEEDFSVIFKEKYLAFSTSPFAKTVLEKKKLGLKLSSTEQTMYSLLIKLKNDQ